MITAKMTRNNVEMAADIIATREKFAQIVKYIADEIYRASKRGASSVTIKVDESDVHEDVDLLMLKDLLEDKLEDNGFEVSSEIEDNVKDVCLVVEVKW